MAQEQIGPYFVSTVWLGIDHKWSHLGPPIIFETMVFPECEVSRRYATEAQARAGHEALCAEVHALTDWQSEGVNDVPPSSDVLPVSGPLTGQQTTSARISTAPEPRTPRHLEHPWMLIVAVGVAGLAIGAAVAPGSTKTVTKPGPTVTATAVVKKVIATRTVVAGRPLTQVSDGIYQVGPDIPPGVYRTSGGEHCYFAVWSSLDTGTVPARSDGARKPSAVEVDQGEAFEVSGGCKWARID
ncbi:MAG: hypothetical protein M3Y44_12030 [Actinomycetota bacterium]|nr:hypothetical protein [Actinomycetota bacterium]